MLAPNASTPESCCSCTARTSITPVGPAKYWCHGPSMLGLMRKPETSSGKFSAPTLVSEGVIKIGLPVGCKEIKGAMASMNS